MIYVHLWINYVEGGGGAFSHLRPGMISTCWERWELCEGVMEYWMSRYGEAEYRVYHKNVYREVLTIQKNLSTHMSVFHDTLW